jgi:hypothetical protein
MREFGNWRDLGVYLPNKEEVRLLDLANTMFYLIDLDYKAGRNYWQTDPIRSREMLAKFRDMGALDILYWYGRMMNLTRVFTEIKGPEEQVCSITRSLLKDVPTSLARMADNGTTALVVSRVPTKESGFFTEIMSQAAENVGLDLKCTFPSAIRNYQADLFRRLLNPDGTWNDDVSGFLSQIRSAPKSTGDEGE